MTCSAADKSATDPLRQARRQIFLALFTALAVALHAVETLLPMPVPWLRLGLANVLALVALFSFGPKAAWSVNLTRVFLGALVLGRLFGPGFWLALAGCLLATLVMVTAHRLAGTRLSPVGISALGAAGHALGQMTAAWLLLVQHPGVWQLFPVFLLFAVLTGVLTGWLATALLEQLQQHAVFREIADGADKD